MLYVLISLLSIIILVILIYIYKSTHFWKPSYNKTIKAGFIEKQARLPDNNIINYAEGPNKDIALLLIHGQTGSWKSYTKVLPKLSKNFHVYAIDCYGHGKSSHDRAKYYIDKNGDDLIWFINNIIKKKTIISGHSSGGLLAAYIASKATENVIGTVLEDPPIFSTERNYFEKSFAYVDTYKTMHNYIQSNKTECWASYYLKNCYWGNLYMKNAMPNLAKFAQNYSKKNPNKPVQFFFMPQSINQIFQFVNEYDFEFGEHFYNYSWHSNISHSSILQNISVPTVFIHAKDLYSQDGILMAASSNEQAKKAKELIKNCKLIELKSNHLIHWYNPKVFIKAINDLFL